MVCTEQHECNQCDWYQHGNIKTSPEFSMGFDKCKYTNLIEYKAQLFIVVISFFQNCETFQYKLQK